MNAKIALALAALSYVPLAVAGNEAAYPKEKVAAFVVEKLDLTSLPSAFRPKKEKGKKTLADYGFTAQRMDENEESECVAKGARVVSRICCMSSDWWKRLRDELVRRLRISSKTVYPSRLWVWALSPHRP